MQSKWYLNQSTSLGVPLDSRHSLTKSDWEMWTAATCASDTRRLFVNSLAYWLNHTASGLPFSDLYNTIGDGVHGSFSARPVAGGHFSLLSLQSAGHWASGPPIVKRSQPSLTKRALKEGSINIVVGVAGGFLFVLALFLVRKLYITVTPDP